MALEYNPSYCPKRTRHKIIEKWTRQEQNEQQLADRYELHLKTVKKYIKRWLEKHTILSDYEIKKMNSKNGIVPREKVFDDQELKEFVLDDCTVTPNKSLSTYSDDIYCVFGIYISRCTVHRMFDDETWKWKCIARVALEMDVAEEVLFWDMISEILTDPNQALWLDESYRSDKTTNAKHGRGPPGPVHMKVSFTTGGYKLTLLLVTYIRGVVVYKILFGAVNESEFNQFIIEDLMEYLNPYPQQFSIIILDNISFHHNEIFLQIADSIGSIIAFLPHYDPITNLSEYGFRDVKQIEISKNIKSEFEAMMSLCDSVEVIRHKDYSKILRQIGYI
eukprot:408843_1